MIYVAKCLPALQYNQSSYAITYWPRRNYQKVCFAELGANTAYGSTISLLTVRVTNRNNVKLAHNIG